MPNFRSRRGSVSNGVFAITVAVLVVVASAGFLLYSSRPTMEETMTVTTSDTMSSNGSSGATATALVAAHGAMFGNGWLVVASAGNGSYIVTLRATGLEPASMGDYIVEAAQNSGQMATVPIAGSNATLSEFEADNAGNGEFFTILHEAPSSAYESVSIEYLPGMQMQEAMVVASASLMK